MCLYGQWIGCCTLVTQGMKLYPKQITSFGISWVRVKPVSVCFKTNNIPRPLIGIGRPVAARAIMTLVSQKLIRTRLDSDFHSNDGIEFQHYQQYISLTDALDSVPSPDTYPSGESAQKRAAWKDAYLVSDWSSSAFASQLTLLQRAIDNAWNLGLDLLTHSWLEHEVFNMWCT